MHFILSKEDYEYMRFDAVDRLSDAKLAELGVVFTSDFTFVDIIRNMISCVVNYGFMNGAYLNLTDTIASINDKMGVTDKAERNTLTWVLNELFCDLKRLVQGNYREGDLYSVEVIKDIYGSSVQGIGVSLVLPGDTATSYMDFISISDLVAAVLPGAD